MIGLQECIYEIAEIFELNPKNRKSYCMRFFFVGYINTFLFVYIVYFSLLFNSRFSNYWFLKVNFLGPEIYFEISVVRDQS